METIGKKYESQRQALFHINRYELVRRATFDLFKAMGRTDEFADNVSLQAKDIAEQLKIDMYNDIGMSIDFKSEEQKNIIKMLDAPPEQQKLLKDF